MGTHFQNNTVKAFLAEHAVLLIDSPTGASNSTGMVERANHLLWKAIVQTVREQISEAAQPAPDWDQPED